MTVPLHTASWRALFEQHASGVLTAVPVRISLGKPRYWPLAQHAPYIKELAPAGLLRQPPLEPNEFDRLYLERLDRFGVDQIAVRLNAVYADYGKPLALACFEADPSDCHRGTFARWWHGRTGQEVSEL